ncbi:MAG: hypothetical protein AAF318_05160 [Pseudomonadota bacterium]
MTAVTISPLEALSAHFDACALAKTPRKVWWRDDDATRCGVRLNALAATAEAAGAPLALAAIPAYLEPTLIDWAADHNIAILQHGVAHTNHEPTGKAMELGPARPVEALVAALVAARPSGATCLPVLVPPWNRMRPDLAPALSKAGYRGLSRFGNAASAGPPRQVDTHIDPIAWRTTRSLPSPDVLSAMVAAAIAQEGPIGLLTHHIVHDAAIDGFVEGFATLVATHPGAAWASAAEVFGL